MHSADASPDNTTLVPGAHRVIRVLGADEGPFTGALVTDRDSVAVLTDADMLAGWAGWVYSGDEHVAGPLDIVRRRDGHDVLLPWCTERVSVFLGRRVAVGEPLSAGETSTLVGSLLRGLDELGRGPRGTEPGEWWLSDHGRPLFVIGEGEDARTAAAALIDRVHRETVDRASARLLSSIRDGLLKDIPRPGAPSRQLNAWEGELFAIAAPRPLRRETHGPELVRQNEMARSLRAAPLETRRDARAAGRAGESGPRTGIMQDAMLSALAGVRGASRRIADLRDLLRMTPLTKRVTRTTAESVDRREQPVRKTAVSPGRRFAVAGATGALILAAGLLWQGGATGEAPAAGGKNAENPAIDAAETSSPESGEPATSSPVPQPTATSEKPAGPPVPGHLDDPVHAAPGLLAAIRECAARADDVCPEAVASGSAAVAEFESAGDGESRAREEQFALVDEYGDVAVIRVAAESAGGGEAPPSEERMLVLVRIDEKWLVRDAYDVADQPG